MKFFKILSLIFILLTQNINSIYPREINSSILDKLATTTCISKDASIETILSKMVELYHENKISYKELCTSVELIAQHIGKKISISLNDDIPMKLSYYLEGKKVCGEDKETADLIRITIMPSLNSLEEMFDRDIYELIKDKLIKTPYIKALKENGTLCQITDKDKNSFSTAFANFLGAGMNKKFSNILFINILKRIGLNDVQFTVACIGAGRHRISIEITLVQKINGERKTTKLLLKVAALIDDNVIDDAMQNEINLFKKLNGKNLTPRIHSYGRYYLLEEFIEGESLFYKLRNKTISNSDAQINILVIVLEMWLATVNESGMGYFIGDLNRDNYIIMPDKTLRCIDGGLAAITTLIDMMYTERAKTEQHSIITCCGLTLENISYIFFKILDTNNKLIYECSYSLLELFVELCKNKKIINDILKSDFESLGIFRNNKNLLKPISYLEYFSFPNLRKLMECKYIFDNKSDYLISIPAIKKIKNFRRAV